MIMKTGSKNKSVWQNWQNQFCHAALARLWHMAYAGLDRAYAVGDRHFLYYRALGAPAQSGNGLSGAWPPHPHWLWGVGTPSPPSRHDPVRLWVGCGGESAQFRLGGGRNCVGDLGLRLGLVGGGGLGGYVVLYVAVYTIYGFAYGADVGFFFGDFHLAEGLEGVFDAHEELHHVEGVRS